MYHILYLRAELGVMSAHSALPDP